MTSGPVPNDAIALAEVSHRSPLALWKLLVRAIASFYRHEDSACREQLDAIDPKSAPAALVPAVRAMLGLESRADLTPAAAALVSQTTVDTLALRNALNFLDRSIDDGHQNAILKAIRAAVQECGKSAPEQLDRVKQHIAVRCAVTDLDKGKMTAALGGQLREDAYFFRLLARGLEQSANSKNAPQDAALACGFWDEFRKQAVYEGWFRANGPETTTLYLHIAEVLRQLPKELQRTLRRNAGQQNKSNREDLYFVLPEELYQRACTLDPHPEAFSEWLDWTSGESPRQAERVAEAWHKIRPLDIDPILHLMNAAADRQAFPKALSYLIRAERIDGVHPAVRRARLRLLVGSAIRHIQQKKPHLAAEKLAELSELPESQQNDRPAFVAALRYLVNLAQSDAEGVAAELKEMERLLDSGIAARLLIFAVATAAKRSAQVQLEPCEKLATAERMALPAAFARVTALARDMNSLSLRLPQTYIAEAAKQLPNVSASLDAGQLRTLAEAGVSAMNTELAYAASAAGLERGASTEARFLLLRALSVPPQRFERRVACAAAALELARERRDQTVVHEAVELLHGPFSDLSLTLDDAREVLRSERAEPKAFAAHRRDPDYDRILKRERCDCPDCRRARGEAVNPFEDSEDIDEDTEEILDELPLPPGRAAERRQNAHRRGS